MLGDIRRGQLAHEPAVGVDHYPVGVEVAHGAPHPVVHVELSIVAPADHTIPDREADAAVGALLSEHAETAPQLARTPVQPLACLVVPGDHHLLRQPRRGGRVRPLGERLLARASGIAERSDPSSVSGPVEVALWVAVVQRTERPALRRVALAHHLRQLLRAERTTDRAEPSAGLHGGELPRVADRDHLHTCPLRGLQQPRGWARRSHPGLVGDQHAVLWQIVAELLEVDQQPVQCARRDAGLLGELAHRAAGRRDAEHRVARALIHLAQHPRRVRLPRPRERLDHAHPVPRPTHRTHRSLPARRRGDGQPQQSHAPPATGRSRRSPCRRGRPLP